MYTKAIEAVLEDPGVDSVIVETIAWDLASPGYLAAAGEMQRRHRKPVVLWQIGAMDISERYRAAAGDAENGLHRDQPLRGLHRGVKAHSRKKETVRTA